MRRFIVTNPNLSVGKPGDVVTASQLRMTDEKLDIWVKAGSGVEIEDDSPPDPPVATISDDAAISDEIVVEISGPAAVSFDGLYDPGDHTVAEVLSHVGDNPDQASEILSRERSGRNRSGIIDPLTSG